VERQSAEAGDTAAQRFARRQEHSRPIVDELRAWIDAKKAMSPPKTPLGAALGYLDRQWKRLLLFLANGNIELTNNQVERELRKLVLGRRYAERPVMRRAVPVLTELVGLPQVSDGLRS
jgi:transposase